MKKTLVAMQVNNNRYYEDGKLQFDDPGNLEILRSTAALLSSSFGKVVLVAPAAPENEIFTRVEGCSAFLGSWEDVGERICGAFRNEDDGDVVIRTFAEQVLDLEIVRLQLKQMDDGGFDYVSPPEGDEYRHGAEVFRLGAMRRTVKHIHDKGLTEHLTRPYLLMRELPEGVKWAPLLTGRGENPSTRTSPVVMGAGRFGIENLNHYRFIRDECIRGGSLLDLGCGSGEGSRVLAQKAGIYLGIDRSPFNIEHANSRFGGERTRFLLADVMDFQPDRKYDRIVSLYLLPYIEGASRKRVFLQRIPQWLAREGKAYFAVSLWGRRAGEILSLASFKSLMEETFRHVQIKGLNKGFMVDEGEAREAAFAVCSA